MRTYKIGEAAALLNLKTYVLRFWETEFAQINPLRTEKGQRLYSEEDLTLLRRIQHLLHDRGMTIEGARKTLAESEARKAAKAKGAVNVVGASEDAVSLEAESDTATAPPIRPSVQHTLDAVKNMVASGSQEPLRSPEPQDLSGTPLSQSESDQNIEHPGSKPFADGYHHCTAPGHPVPSSQTIPPGNGKTHHPENEPSPDHAINEHKLILREIAGELSRLADFLRETETNE